MTLSHPDLNRGLHPQNTNLEIVSRFKIPPPVACHPSIEVCDFRGAAGKHDKVRHASRSPVIEVYL